MNSYDAYRLTLKTGVSSLELERIISKDGYYSYYYALDILRGQFELGELAISKHGFYSPFCYAVNILRGRFRLGEEIIVKHFFYSCKYLVKAIGYNHE